MTISTCVGCGVEGLDEDRARRRVRRLWQGGTLLPGECDVWCLADVYGVLRHGAR